MPCRWLTNAQLEAIERTWLSDESRTHWDGCHASHRHHACAIALLLLEVRKLRQAMIENTQATVRGEKYVPDWVREIVHDE